MIDDMRACSQMPDLTSSAHAGFHPANVHARGVSATTPPLHLRGAATPKTPRSHEMCFALIKLKGA